VVAVAALAVAVARLVEPAISSPPGSSSDFERYLELASAPVSKETRAMALAELRLGLKLGSARDMVNATRAFERAAALLPGFADWSIALNAQAAASAGDSAAVTRHLSATDPEIAREWGWRVRADGHRNAGDLRGAESAVRGTVPELANAARRSAAWNAIAAIALERADSSAARTAYREAIAAAPSSVAALRAARGLELLKGLTPSDKLAIARVDLRHGRLTSGITGLRSYLDSGSDTAAERSAVLLELTQSFFAARRYAEAERSALRSAADTTKPTAAAQALLIAGRSQLRQGRTAEARRSLQRATARFPKEPATQEAWFILADLEHGAGNHGSAREYYRRIIALEPESNVASAAFMRLGGIALASGDASGAASIFEEYRQAHESGDTHLQAAYWAGRAHLALGDSTRARKHFTEAARGEATSYYAMRAADRIGQAAAFKSLPEAPVASSAIPSQVVAGLMRIDLLAELELPEAIELDTERLKRYLATQPGGLYALAEAYHARGQHYDGILLGREIQRTAPSMDLRLLRIIYPFPYRELVVRESAGNGIDPFLIAGLIRQESMFKPTALSRAGAIGLMQIMPSTGRTLARGLALTRFQTRQLYQPELNIRLGTRFAADLLRRHGGDVTEMLAAYNAGPIRLASWSAFPEHADKELFAERIPFEETRDYVRIVQRNARLYRALYGPADDISDQPR
jgi:soluble lytic murein transglycosylase